MSNGYFRLGIHNKQACFHHFFRKPPFKSTFVVAAGLEIVLDYLANFRFSRDDIDFLASLNNAKGTAQFDKEFLNYLSNLRLEVEVDAVKEGQIVFAREPMMRVRGPILQCQILETALLNIVNFQSLIATKAARCTFAAKGREVSEFGLRRAQGPDGGVSATRASFVGGCTSTSNVLAAKEFHIPVKGTMAHSWVMAFEDELTAFRAFASVMPYSTMLLVDTYHTLEGVRNAITVGHELAKNGGKLSGIRLDSGDLASLSKTARGMLDEAGLFDAKIMVSGELDEYKIERLLAQGAPIDSFGVGTKLSTAFDEPALSGVYKLSQIEGDDHVLKACLKISDDMEKTTLPGLLQTRRYTENSKMLSDLIFDSEEQEPSPDDLLVPVFSNGSRVIAQRTLQEIQDDAKKMIALLDEKHLALKNPLEYPVTLSKNLEEKQKKIMKRVEE